MIDIFIFILLFLIFFLLIKRETYKNCDILSGILDCKKTKTTKAITKTTKSITKATTKATTKKTTKATKKTTQSGIGSFDPSDSRDGSNIGEGDNPILQTTSSQ